MNCLILKSPTMWQEIRPDFSKHLLMNQIVEFSRH